jgi:hypothetical protein
MIETGVQGAMSPIFLYSTARSGSTLLQRILGANPEIATASEPWLLLPLIYAFRQRGVYAEYEHGTLARAMEDFCEQLPQGRADFNAEMARFAMRLYQRSVGPQHRYFLDKTPPYFLVVREILETFPQAKHVFLWRNPLAVAASLAEWPERNWGGLYRENLFFGLANLISAYQENQQHVYSVRFEDYLTGDPDTWHGLMAYLDLPFRPETLREFSEVKLEGRMGDQHGVKLYGALSRDPLTKWQSSLSNPLRKEAARRYLAWLGQERLAIMGYDAHELFEELKAVPTSMRNVGSDLRNLAKVLATEPLYLRLRRASNVRRASSLRYILGAGRSI